MDDVLFAAMIWEEARSRMVNSQMNDPSWEWKLNELSEAEDLLSRAVKHYLESLK